MLQSSIGVPRLELGIHKVDHAVRARHVRPNDSGAPMRMPASETGSISSAIDFTLLQRDKSKLSEAPFRRCRFRYSSGSPEAGGRNAWSVGANKVRNPLRRKTYSSSCSRIQRAKS